MAYTSCPCSSTSAATTEQNAALEDPPHPQSFGGQLSELDPWPPFTSCCLSSFSLNTLSPFRLWNTILPGPTFLSSVSPVSYVCVYLHPRASAFPSHSPPPPTTCAEGVIAHPIQCPSRLSALRQVPLSVPVPPAKTLGVRILQF